jgi:hypothetical protein
VEGYFSPGDVPRQVGMQVLVQPSSVGPFTFGNATRVGGAIEGQPGAFSITSLHPRDAEDVEHMRELSRATAAQMTELDGFMGWVGVVVGDRMLTITAWQSPEQSKQVLKLAPHVQGTRGFFGTDYAQGGWVSVWSPERFGAAWVRCGSCGAMADPGDGATCACGEALPTGRTYW